MGQKVTAFTGIGFGTLHIALCGRSRIIVASDSRGHSPDTGPFGDDFQKLFKAGRRTLCTTSGLLTLPPDLHAPVYVSTLIGALCVDDALQDSPKDLLRGIGAALRGRISALFARQAPPDMASIFSAFSVHRSSSGVINFWELDFPVLMSVAGTRIIGEPKITQKFKNYSGRPFAYYSGNEIPVGSMDNLSADAPDEGLLTGIDSVFEGARSLNASAHNEIGGPIDVAVIDPRGFRWLRRKPIELPPGGL